MNPTPYKPLYQFLALSITLIPCFLCSSSLDQQHYAYCDQTFKCGDPSVLGDLKYPFWGVNRQRYCGEPGYELKCVNNTPFIPNSPYNLQVIGTNPQFNEMKVAIADFRHNLRPSRVFNRNYGTNTSFLDLSIGNLYMGSTNSFLTILYGCPSDLGHQLSWSSRYSCPINDSVSVHFVTHTANVSLTSECLGVVVLPILQENAEALDDNRSNLTDALDEGFEMYWNTQQDSKCKSCMGSGGGCGYDWSDNQFTCYSPDNTYPMICPQSLQGKHNKMIAIPVLAAAAVGIVMLGFLIFFYKDILQKCKPIPQNRSVEDCLKKYASLVPKRYTYTYIKKITKSFKEKLGEGGYGAVFKGSLQDGRYVAVKVWKQSKGDGEEFINEVMSISGTSHVNVVLLLGFCFEGHKRALIYEFMPNGSLEKFLHGRNLNENNKSLSAQKLSEIALGIARGLEYLHRGCNTRIVHFDIKPHNILLDAEFTPKISDFGLAKSLKKKESMISMSGARGTVGYIAPEVFLRSFGGVSHKSDVYSFGMMTLEMVGRKKRVNEIIDNSSDMYFPQWVYKELEQEATLDCERIVNEEEIQLERKMTLVGLWCIQTNPSYRPSMSRVVEMLEGKVELIEVPPMPTLASLPSQQQQPTDENSANVLSSTI